MRMEFLFLQQGVEWARDEAKKMMEWYEELVEEVKGMYEDHEDKMRQDAELDEAFRETLSLLEQGASPQELYYILSDLYWVVVRSSAVKSRQVE